MRIPTAVEISNDPYLWDQPDGFISFGANSLRANYRTYSPATLQGNWCEERLEIEEKKLGVIPPTGFDYTRLKTPRGSLLSKPEGLFGASQNSPFQNVVPNESSTNPSTDKESGGSTSQLENKDTTDPSQLTLRTSENEKQSAPERPQPSAIRPRPRNTQWRSTYSEMIGENAANEAYFAMINTERLTRKKQPPGGVTTVVLG